MCRALPSSLLLLSRAFTVTLPVGGEASEFDSLKDTIGALPNKVINEVGMEATAADGYAHAVPRNLEEPPRHKLSAWQTTTENQPVLACTSCLHAVLIQVKADMTLFCDICMHLPVHSHIS